MLVNDKTFRFYRRVEQLAARRVHTPEVAGSSPASATSFSLRDKFFKLFPGLFPLGGDLFRARALLQSGDNQFVQTFARKVWGWFCPGFDAVDHFLISFCGAMLPGVGSAGLFLGFSLQAWSAVVGHFRRRFGPAPYVNLRIF
jgi:hypothetical protein